MTEAERIAAGLTETQRKAVLAFRSDKYLTASAAGVAGRTASSLWNRPVGPNLEAPDMLLTRDYTDYPRLNWTYRLTDLGLAVRAILQGDAV